MSRPTWILARQLGLFMSLGCLACAAALAFLGISQNRLVAVQSDSMRPIFQAGDALLLKKVNPHALQVGDIITYHSNDDPKLTISHRIVQFDTERYITEGDAQQMPGAPVPRSAVIGQAIGVAPKLGYILSWLHTKWGLLALLYIPAALVAATEVFRLLQATQQSVYSLR